MGVKDEYSRWDIQVSDKAGCSLPAHPLHLRYSLHLHRSGVYRADAMLDIFRVAGYSFQSSVLFATCLKYVAGARATTGRYKVPFGLTS